METNKEFINFITKEYGKIETTIQEIIPNENITINVHVVLPNEKNNFTTFITHGMSDRPMDINNYNPDLDFAELVVKIPSSWEITQENFKSDKYFWILKWLKFLAYMPHEYDGFIDSNLIIPKRATDKF